MTEHEDSRLVDYLYGEMADEDARVFEQAMADDQALAEDVDALDGLLGSLREADEADAPASHLDALILAHAREAAEANRPIPWYRRVLFGPVIGVVAVSACAVFMTVIYVPLSSESLSPPPAATAPPAYAPEERTVTLREQPAVEVQARLAKNEAEPPSGGAVAKLPAAAPVTRQRSKVAELDLAEGERGYGSGSTAERRRDSNLASKPKRKARAAPKPRSAPAKSQDNLQGKKESAKHDRSRSLGSAEVPTATPPPPRAPADQPAAPAPDPEATPMEDKRVTGSGGVFAGADGDADDMAASGPAPRMPAGELRAEAGRAVGGELAEVERRESQARALARDSRTRAQKAVASGDVDQARRIYADARRATAGTLAYFELTLWLARLEYDHARYGTALALAREASSSRDSNLRAQAREVVARVEHEQGERAAEAREPASAAPAPADSAR